MQLEELYDYKNQLMEDLLTTDSIVELLVDEDYPVEDASELAYKNVFPCEYVADTIEDGRTIICFDVDVQKSVNKTFLLPTLYVWVLHIGANYVCPMVAVSELIRFALKFVRRLTEVSSMA